ncbi:MAG: zinc-ribbon domain-containing protein [Gemmatimonadaceae bacterium]|nr:zinc-ribbon domain-containing protein [Gemmatimonadaceae bacterium]
MNVSCRQCATVYRVDPAKVPTGGVRARCSTCSGVIPVGIAASGPATRMTPAEPVGVAFNAGPAMPAEKPTAAGPFIPSRPSRPTPVAPQARVTPAASPRVATPQALAPPLGASLPPLWPTPRTPWPSVTAAPPASAPARVSAPAPPASPPPLIESHTSEYLAAAEADVPSLAPTTTFPVVSIPPATRAPTPATPVSPAPGERRPINPFLARDPSLRARRLSRALVSDMVAYYPAKHAEGLEKGTLKELFRDEIRKSYEEYIAQVGADFARSTTHFQESLNEVLGAGKKIF